jgi:hypothetical protein
MILLIFALNTISQTQFCWLANFMLNSSPLRMLELMGIFRILVLACNPLEAVSPNAWVVLQLQFNPILQINSIFCIFHSTISTLRGYGGYGLFVVTHPIACGFARVFPKPWRAKG